QRIKCAGRERLRIYFLKGSARTTLLCFHKNKDGNMAWMLVGPASDLFKTCDKRLAGTAVIDVLHVHHFKARLAHQPVRIEIRIGRKMRIGHKLRSERMRVQPALAV